MVPTPNWYSRPIASNNSASLLLFKPHSIPGVRPKQNSRSMFTGGPNQTIKVDDLEYRNDTFFGNLRSDICSFFPIEVRTHEMDIVRSHACD
jgi:hypothetical protein